MSQDVPTIILQKLATDEKFCRRVLPFVKPEYFEKEHRVVHGMLLCFLEKYNRLPTRTTLSIDLPSTDVTEEQYPGTVHLIESLSTPPEVEEQWLIDTTEKWCKDRAVYLAIMEAIQIIDGKAKDKTQGAIPEILQKAISVSFDSSVGHDYLDDSSDRFDFYHRVEHKLPFDLEMLNRITNGGLTKKTLNVFMGGTGAGKTIFLCHCAASYLSQGKNVLYITMEMAEERIAERIDANLMGVDISMLGNLSKEMFEDRVAKIASKTQGKLIIKEYPTASAHVGHFRALLNELKLKRNFKPDAIVIDYLNICASSRIKGLGSSVNTYSLIKAIAEEVRGLAMEFDVPILTATQTNRAGYGDTDVDITDVSESFGLPQTADLMLAIITTEDLDKMGQVMVKQLKNRYNDVVKDRRFVLGLDRAKMRLYDVDEKAQNLMRDAATSTKPPLIAATDGQATAAMIRSRVLSGTGIKV